MSNLQRYKATMAENWLSFAYLAAAKAGRPMLGWVVDCEQMIVTLRAFVGGKPYTVTQAFDDFGAMPDQAAMIALMVRDIEGDYILDTPSALNHI